MFKKLLRFIVGHKIASVVAAIVLAYGGYSWYAALQGGGAPTKYVLQKATVGTIVASVSGSGQMQALTTVNIKPQVTETVTAIPVKVGDRVAAGQLLVALDTTNEARAVAQAKLSLQSAQLTLAKLMKAPATTTLIQDQNAVTEALQALATASSTLQKDYQSGFDSLSSAFVDMQTVMAGLQSFVTGNDISKVQNNPDAYVNLMPNYLTSLALPYRNAVMSDYAATQAAYQQDLADYHATSRSSDPPSLDALFSETYATARAISEGVKSVKDLLNYVVNNYPSGTGSQLPAITNTFQANMNSYTNAIGGDVTSLGGVLSTITADKTSLSSANLSYNQASSTLAALLAGADSLDIQSDQLAVQQQQLALQTAEQNLNDSYIRSPINGVVSAIPAVMGETVSSPAISVVGQSQVAVVTLNEVDAARVTVGDKATMTFDAIPGLSIAGQVIELDPVGTVSQGVVDYNAQIAFAQPNDQVKPGMSVTADIITQVDQDVVIVPNSAITTQGGADYVLEPSFPLSDAEIASSSPGGIVISRPLKRVPVTLGISNDTDTEITSGISAGDEIIAQTIRAAGSAGTSALPGTSLGGGALRALGGGGGSVFFGAGAGGGTHAGGAGGGMGSAAGR